MTAWKHDDLMMDLAGHLRGPDVMVWTDMQLGPSGSPRPDVYTLRKSYSKPMPTAFEVKVSRSDLRSDTTSGKWQSYMKYAGSVTFAVPDGLCTVAEIPDGCGLIVRKDAVWRYARRPTIQRITLPMDACMKLLIDGAARISRPVEPQPRRAELWKLNESIRKKFGEAVAEAARDLAAVQDRITRAKETERYEYDRVRQEAETQKAYLIEQAKKAASEFEAAKRDLCAWLGLPPETSTFAVRRAIQSLKTSCDADERVSQAEGRVAQARRSLEHALASIPAEDAQRQGSLFNQEAAA